MLDFLNTELTVNPNDLPQRLRKLVKIIKAVLDKPDLLLIDQQALDLVTFDFAETFKKLQKLLPNTSFLVIMSKYEDLLLTKRAIILHHGEDPKRKLFMSEIVN